MFPYTSEQNTALCTNSYILISTQDTFLLLLFPMKQNSRMTISPTTAVMANITKSNMLIVQLLNNLELVDIHDAQIIERMKRSKVNVQRSNVITLVRFTRHCTETDLRY